MYYGDYQLVKDRTEQMRAEIHNNRLGAALANSNRIEKAGYATKSPVARVTTLVAALIR
jgi:hypothetical protein